MRREMIRMIVNGLQTSIMKEVERILFRKDYLQLSDKIKVLVSISSQVFSLPTGYETTKFTEIQNY